ncbi:MAG: hypothetical protein KDB02_15960 [Acidimicrobiales bacterium]|nr:hypothetical protein [Acidimicrobiales bacterium]
MSEPTLRRVGGCPFRWVDDRVLVLRSNGTVTRLGGAAAVVWEVTDLAVTRREIVERAGALAPVDLDGIDSLESWVGDAIDGMVEKGLLVEAGVTS